MNKKKNKIGAKPIKLRFYDMDSENSQTQVCKLTVSDIHCNPELI